MLKFYYLITRFIPVCVFERLLKKRLIRNKEHPIRYKEKLGIIHHIQPPEKPCIWIHAASLGEIMSMRFMIDLCLRKPCQLLITTSTRTSQEYVAGLQKQFPEIKTQFLPYDHPKFIKTFLTFWQPQCILWVEQEFWPNWLLYIKRMGVPCLLLNARMSEKSYKKWSKFLPDSAQNILSVFTLCLAQSERHNQYLKQLKAPYSLYGGNLKYTNLPLSVDESGLLSMEKALQGRYVFVASSIHPAEVETILNVHLSLLKDHAHFLTIIIPRHADDIALNEPHEIRTTLETPSSTCSLFLVKTYGELGLFYKIANCCFIGGSLFAHGGHNPIQAIQFGKPVIHGPYVENFDEIYQELAQEHLSLSVTDAETLTQAILKQMASSADVAEQASNFAKEKQQNIQAYYQYYTEPFLNAATSTC